MKTRRINSMSALQLEKQRLQHLISSKEQELTELGSRLRENAKSMLWHFVNPFKKEQLVSGVGSVLPVIANVVTGGKLKGASLAAGAVGHVLSKYGAKWGSQLIRKFKDRKKNSGRQQPDQPQQ